jgi:hypothetical protein
MSRPTRRVLHFESLEDLVLLSRGLADPAAAIEQGFVQPLHLNGAVVGFPLGLSHQGNYTVSSFLVEGHAGSMHRVAGLITLANPVIQAGKEPNLNDATLTLANKLGSVILAIKWWKKNLYHFSIVSAANVYTGAAASGEVAILSTHDHSSMEFVIRLRTTGR